MDRAFAVCFIMLVCLQPCLCSYLPKRVVAMDYPPLGISARIEGEVDIEIRSNGEGQVVSTKRISGNPLLADAAEKNVRQWRFEVKARDSEPTVIKYKFTLKGTASGRSITQFIYEVPDTVYVESQFQHWMP